MYVFSKYFRSGSENVSMIYEFGLLSQKIIDLNMFANVWKCMKNNLIRLIQSTKDHYLRYFGISVCIIFYMYRQMQLNMHPGYLGSGLS